MRSPYVQQRHAKDGTRYTGYWYDQAGQRRSAGTYDTAEEAGFRARDAQRRGGVEADPPLRQGPSHPCLDEEFRAYSERYVRTTPDLLTGTKRGYEANLRLYVWPRWPGVLVREVTREMVAALLEELQAEGMSAKSANQVRSAIGTCFKPLLRQRAIDRSPTHGIDLAIPPSPPFRLVTVEDYRRIAACLPSDGARLFADFVISTGLRYGEATEVRAKDFHAHADLVVVARRAVVAGRRWSTMGRFRVDPGTKAGRNAHRSIVLPRPLTERVQAWIDANAVAPGDLLFAKDLVAPNVRPRAGDGERDGSSFTGRDGRAHRHGTRYAYASGGCRCEPCKAALREYRAGRKAPGDGQRNVTGHMANETWRRIWRRAIEDAGLGWYPRMHDLRHAYATHLASSNVDPLTVMELLGQTNLSTTRIYFHRAMGQDTPAVRAAADFLDG